MKSKLLLCLALVLSGGLHSFADTNSFLFSILQTNGDKLGCHFTLEYQGDGITGKTSLLNMPVRTNLTAASIPSLVSNLRGYLDGFAVVQDVRNPRIVHIIEKALADDPNYVLNKKISLNYSGSLNPANVPDANRPGHAIANGGILSAVADKAGRIMGGSRDSTFLGMAGDDGATRVSVNATNETVRSILTDCLPANYNPVMWRATTVVMTGLDGKKWVLVQFFGQKKL